MKTLMIEDLSVAKELDRHAMSAVRGGTYLGGFEFPLYPSAKIDTTFSAQQLTSQSNYITNNTGNNVAFAYGITSTVTPSQSAENTINFGH